MRDCLGGRAHQWTHRHDGERKRCVVSGQSLFSCADYALDRNDIARTRTVTDEVCQRCGRRIHFEGSARTRPMPQRRRIYELDHQMAATRAVPA